MTLTAKGTEAMAKLKQIAIEPARGERTGVLWGLCRDGSLWMRDLGGGNWLRVDGPADAPAMPRRKRAAAAQIELPSMRVSGGMAE